MVLAALVLGLAAVTALLKGKQQLKLRRTRCEIRRRLGPYSLLYAAAFVFLVCRIFACRCRACVIGSVRESTACFLNVVIKRVCAVFFVILREDGRRVRLCWALQPRV